MTHQNNTTNWVIQGPNGQSQLVKIQSGGKSITGIMTPTLAGQQVKLSQTFSTTGTQIQGVKPVVASPLKYVTKAVPIHVNAMPKGTKTVRLTPSQMSQMQSKLLSATSQKIQIQTEGLTTIPTLQQTSVNIQHNAVGLQHQNQKNVNLNVSPHILSRKRQDPLAFEYTPEAKRSRKSDKVGKGLRHFSMKVCEKVRKKGTTTYNEVADELVGEFTNPSNNNSLADQYDQKNIRRRVYDALNVLMAMNIISKEKKEIKWIGLPTNSLQECIQLEKEQIKKLQVVREKKKQLLELILNHIAFKNLAARNRHMEEINGRPHPNSYIQLPFLVVHTDKKTLIDCSISNDKMEYQFQFNDKFEINDDAEILKYIGMHMGLDTGECTPENLARMKQMVPASLEEYVDLLAQGGLQELEEYSGGISGECGGGGGDICGMEMGQVAGTSSSMSMLLNAEDLVETHLDEENSRQSSSNDNLDYSDDDPDSDISTDIDCN